MKRKLLALILVVVLSVACLTSCDAMTEVKKTVKDIVGEEIYLKMAYTYHDIKDAVEDVLGIAAEESSETQK